MSIRRLVLTLVSEGTPELYQTRLERELDTIPLICVRGKTSGAFRGAGTFQWTKAVRAITLVLIEHKRLGEELVSFEPILSGEHDSLASSLDYAISKKPQWISDMFGTTVAGDLFASRIFLRSNPNQKRCGPVGISINTHLLTSNQIEILMDGRPCNKEQLARLAHKLSQELSDKSTPMAA